LNFGKNLTVPQSTSKYLSEDSAYFLCTSIIEVTFFQIKSKKTGFSILFSGFRAIRQNILRPSCFGFYSLIIIHRKVENDPVTTSIIKKCRGIPIKFVSDGKPESVVQTSEILSAVQESEMSSPSGNLMLNKIIAGKQVLFVAPAAGETVDTFTMPDDRILCPHFARLKLASNGCFYQCDWCYLKLTYRAAFPFVTVRAEYDKIIVQLEKRLSTNSETIIFNSGELADSLSLEFLIGAARRFIPWFGTTENGYLFILTKSDNVNDILDLQHNGHTIMPGA
jgi:hypothetical protein